MKKRGGKAVWIIGILLAVLVMVGGALNKVQPNYRAPDAAFDDAAPVGGKGLALLLKRIGYTVKAQQAPLQAMPKDARVWMLLGPKTEFSKREGEQLLAWVKAGNTLFFCVDRSTNHSFSFEPSPGIAVLTQALETSDVPMDFGLSFGPGGLPELKPLAPAVPSNARAGVKGARASGLQINTARAHLEIAGAPGGTLTAIPYGKGRVWVAPDAWLFTNYGLSKPDNAVLLTNLVRLSAPTGTVYFDQRANGENGGAPTSARADSLIARLKKPPVSYALWQLLGAGLLFWAFAARRLGAPVPLPQSGPVTRASQFAQAMGGLFTKSGRPRAAAEIIGDNFRRRLAKRLGLSPGEPDEVLARRAHETSGVPYEVVDRLLLQTRTPPGNDAQALRDAQEMDAVLKRVEGRE